MIFHRGPVWQGSLCEGPESMSGRSTFYSQARTLWPPPENKRRWCLRTGPGPESCLEWRQHLGLRPTQGPLLSGDSRASLTRLIRFSQHICLVPPSYLQLQTHR